MDDSNNEASTLTSHLSIFIFVVYLYTQIFWLSNNKRLHERSSKIFSQLLFLLRQKFTSFHFQKMRKNRTMIKVSKYRFIMKMKKLMKWIYNPFSTRTSNFKTIIYYLTCVYSLCFALQSFIICCCFRKWFSFFSFLVHYLLFLIFRVRRRRVRHWWWMIAYR